MSGQARLGSVSFAPVYRLIPFLLLLPTLAAGRTRLDRKDRLALRYSNQVLFDRNGEPLVSVRITEGQRTITLQSDGPVTLIPGAGEDGDIVAPARSRWTITLQDAHPGTVRYWIGVKRLPAADFEAIAQERIRWTALGHEVSIFEAGALIGLSGQTLDTRTVTIAVDPQPDRATAEAHAKTLDSGLHTVIIDEPMTRPTGLLVARDTRSGMIVHARDLLWLSASDGHTLELPGLEWGHGTPKRGRADRRYLGDVYVTVGNDAKLAAVNLLGAERMLEGVVPSEIPASAPAAALRAQAIAARGQLLAKVGTRHRSDPYLLCAETHCQKYTGDTRRRSRTSKAVADTRGELLFDARGLVDTVYSSACGGHSEAFHQMWGGLPNPTLIGRFDADTDPGGPIQATQLSRFIDHPPQAWCGEAKVYRWKRTRTDAQVDAAVKRYGRVGHIHTIRPVRRGVSGRALAVEYSGDKGQVVVEGSYRNRTLLGALRSGMWLVEHVGTKWYFRGGGFGHGVGLCQHGAMGMARAGKSHTAILQHYYLDSRIQRAW